MFKYKTRGMSSPQGKRRIYFTCHPEDYEKYFEQISAELLKITDCAIYYSTDESYEDINTDLGQMNLFVIPITTILLTKPCRAINIDVHVAIEKHIPILPLMQEGSLDELFTKHFGDLQYLDPNAHDETAISYEEKLKKYLSSVLDSDELAKKVRAAFDAYIFLSYRKKDRKYANELMRLIHKNEICRDIAIWYDEFLVPGENFNEAISDALKKSELFALVVTPNLVNEINYVQTVEYPEAVKQNKTVLPAELVKTDYIALSEKFPDIPKGVDVHDEIKLSKALENALVRIAHEENDTDPQHNFFIGLAYLEGIDVEVNHERGLSLITSAAEAKENKVPEAIEKLVSMYSSGQGVKRDYRVAVEWQKKLLGYYKVQLDKYTRPITNLQDYSRDYWKFLDALENLTQRLYSDLQDFENAENYCRALLPTIEKVAENNISFEFRLTIFYELLGNIYEDRGKLDEAEELYRKILKIADHLIDKLEDVYQIMVVQNKQSIMYGNLGNLYNKRKEFDKAEEFYRKGILLAENNIKKIDDVNCRRSLAILYGRLVDLCIKHGRKEEVEELYRKDLTITEQLVDETNSVLARRDLAILYENIGKQCMETKEFDKAECFYQKSYNLIRIIAEETEHLDDYRLLSLIYSDLGKLSWKVHNDKDKAQQYFLKSLSLREMLKEKTKSSRKSLLDLSDIYSSLGAIYFLKNPNSGQFKLAEEYYQKALKIYEWLGEKNRIIETRKELSAGYSILGYHCNEQDKTDEAEVLYRKEMHLRELLLEDEYDIENQKLLIACYGTLGDICKKRKNIEESNFFYLKVLSLCEVHTNERDNLDYLRYLQVCYGKLGKLFEECKDLDKAEIFYRKELITSELFAKKTDTEDDWRHVLICNANFGDFCIFRGNQVEAEEFYRKSVVISEQVVEKNDSISNRYNLSISYSKLGTFFKEFNDLKRAEIFYRKKLATDEWLAEKSRTIDTKHVLASSYETLGYLCEARNKLNEAEMFFRKGLELREFLVEETGTVKNRYQLSGIYRELGSFCEAKGSLDEALLFYRKNFKICKQLVTEIKDVNSYELYAFACLKLAIIQNPFDQNLLKEALQIYTQLAIKYPHEILYSKNRDLIKDTLSHQK